VKPFPTEKLELRQDHAGGEERRGDPSHTPGEERHER
jgi:hypothetical protein